MDNKVITRFAPSPTGFMHVGNLRTALYAYLVAKKYNGTFILRIEDTDKEREVPGSIEHIMKVLGWVGMNWDYGPDVGGPNAPYTQSERLDLYTQYAQKLIDGGFAYPDPYTEEEVEEFRKKAEEEKRPFLFREHRPDTFEKWDGKKPLRFKVAEIKSYKWHDLVFGELQAGPEALDDFILIKSDGYPTYNFCHIVDDIEMKITHVIRGQEYISSTPKYLALYEALGEKPPLYVCLPHILGKDGNKKLGKRDGAKDALQYKEEGYLPEAIVNFLALLGWHPQDDQEIFSMDELINSFEIERIQKSGAQWNDEKLDWMNKKYIKEIMSNETYLKYIYEYNFISDFYIENIEKSILDTILLFLKERIVKFSDINKELDLIYTTIITKKNINLKKAFLFSQGIKFLINEIDSITPTHLGDQQTGNIKSNSYKETLVQYENKRTQNENNIFKIISSELDIIQGENNTLPTKSKKGKWNYLFEDPILNVEEVDKIYSKEIKDNDNKNKIIQKHLQKIVESFEEISEDNWDEESIRNSIWKYASDEGRSIVLGSLRYVLSGKEKSIDVFSIAKIIGKPASIRRINRMIKWLK